MLVTSIAFQAEALVGRLGPRTTRSCADDEACPRVWGVLRDVDDLVAETLIDTPDVLAEGLSHLEGHLAFVVRRVDLAPRREDEHAVVVAVVVHTRRRETEAVGFADEIRYPSVVEGARMFVIVGLHPLQHEVAVRSAQRVRSYEGIAHRRSRVLLSGACRVGRARAIG